MISSISNNALQGLQTNRNGMARNASEIASAGNLSAQKPAKDMTRSLVELNQHKNGYVASAKVLKTANEVLGSLLDVKA